MPDTLLDSCLNLPTVWTYWEGDPNPVINLCIETLFLHNPTLRVMQPTTIEELGGGDILKETEGVIPGIRSDYIRFWLLHTFGGVWVDADTIGLSPLDWLPRVTELDLAGVYNRFQTKGYGKHLHCSPLGCRAGSPLMGELLATCFEQMQLLKGGGEFKYGQSGPNLVSKLWKREKKKHNPNITRFEHWRYSRVPWFKAQSVYNQRATDEQHQRSTFYNHNGVLYHLGRLVVEHHKNANREQLLNGDSFLSFLFRRALTKETL